MQDNILTADKAVARQQMFFRKGKTRSIEERIRVLTKLAQAIRNHEEDLYQAFAIDLGKSKTETYMAEISVVLAEISYLKKNLRAWAKPENVPGTLGIFPGKSRIYKEPYGVVLVLAPWNYPLLLSISPLAGAVAAGNCVMLKASKSSPNCARVIGEIVKESADPAWVSCFDPKEDYDTVVEQDYQYIFFTGSPRVGKTIMEKAAKRLIPVSLELGGKSPCIVTASANLPIAAKRIVWGKLLNAGQTCITVDYILADQKIKDKLIHYIQEEIKLRFPNAVNNDSYPHIISDHHVERLMGLIEAEAKLGKVLTAEGETSEEKLSAICDRQEKRIAPVILPDADFDHPTMEAELFGPILPVIGYDKLDEIVEKINDRPHPLACYIFTENKGTAKKLIDELPYGGGCVNDTILHISNHHMPFGGVGNSGMGGYHGKYSFDTFTHRKSMVLNTTKIDLPVRYGPFSEKKWKLLKKLL